MLLKYSTTHPDQNELDSLPRAPLILKNGNQSIEVMGLVDSGATINVLPFSVGERLGFKWNHQKAVIRLSGNLGQSLAQPIVVHAHLGDFDPVRLAFAWVQHNEVPVILGQTNFFAEFDIHFYRSRLEFEIKPKSS